MIDHYLEKGTMYVLEDGNVKAECVVTDEDNGILEIKNIAVDPQSQGQGYGKALIDFLASKYADEYSILQVGTGDSPLTVPFYEECGFVRSHNIPNFFTDNYDTEPFDLIFMDAAKGQYIHFMPDILRLLKTGGTLVSDNVLQDGDIIESHYAVIRRNRTIYKRMREYLYELTHRKDLVTAVLPVGDGITVSTKVEVENDEKE